MKFPIFVFTGLLVMNFSHMAIGRELCGGLHKKGSKTATLKGYLPITKCSILKNRRCTISFDAKPYTGSGKTINMLVSRKAIRDRWQIKLNMHPQTDIRQGITVNINGSEPNVFPGSLLTTRTTINQPKLVTINDRFTIAIVDKLKKGGTEPITNLVNSSRILSFSAMGIPHISVLDEAVIRGTKRSFAWIDCMQSQR